MKRIVLNAAILILSYAWLVGCATPAAVKTLSAEQTRTLQQYHETQKKYFALIEKYVESQIQTTSFHMKEINREIEKKYRQKAAKELEGANAEKASQVIDQLIKNINENAEGDLQKKETLSRLLLNLKQKHADMLGAYTVLVAAQKKLDEYVQTAKADEVLANQLLSAIGVQQAKVDAAFTDVADVLDKIQNFSREGQQ